MRNGAAARTFARGTARMPSRIAASISSWVVSSSVWWMLANAIAVDSRSDSADARSIRRATTSSSIRRSAETSAPITTSAAAPINSSMPASGDSTSVRTANTTASAAAAARIVAVVAPSRAHCSRIRARAVPMTRRMAEVSITCGMVPSGRSNA